MALYLVRHGSTSLNVGGDGERLRGWLDVPLDEKGIKEARRTAQQLARNFKGGAPIIISSDLPRAMQTAQIIRAHLPDTSPVVPSEFLRPWNVGAFAGIHLDEGKKKLLYSYYKDNAVPPDGEPYGEFETRWRRGYDLLRSAARKQDVIGVTHVRNFQALAHRPGERPDKVFTLGPDPGEYEIH